MSYICLLFTFLFLFPITHQQTHQWQKYIAPHLLPTAGSLKLPLQIMVLSSAAPPSAGPAIRRMTLRLQSAKQGWSFLCLAVVGAAGGLGSMSLQVCPLHTTHITGTFCLFMLRLCVLWAKGKTLESFQPCKRHGFSCAVQLGKAPLLTSFPPARSQLCTSVLPPACAAQHWAWDCSCEPSAHASYSHGTFLFCFEVRTHSSVVRCRFKAVAKYWQLWIIPQSP